MIFGSKILRLEIEDSGIPKKTILTPEYFLFLLYQAKEKIVFI
jgi:hypothetical protein